MRRWQHLLGAVSLVVGVWAVSAGMISQAQDSADTTLRVGFVEEARSLNMASVTDPGPDGLTRLAELFREYGAATGMLSLDAPIPDDVDIIVLVRPMRSLPAQFLARVYEALHRGASLLLAIDPTRHASAATDSSTSGISMLLGGDYGVSLVDVFLVEEYFTGRSVRQLQTSFSFAMPPTTRYAVTEPLHTYDLHPQLWGARALDVSAVTIQSMGYPVLVAEPYYGERDSTFFNVPPTPTRTPEVTAVPTSTPEGFIPTATPRPPNTPIPPGYQITLDLTGQFNVGAFGVNIGTGSRVAVFADSELFQNAYGLAVSSRDGRPLHVANQILVERVVAWMVEAESYPPLPQGFTYINMDGVDDDWATGVGSAIADGVEDATIASFNMTNVRLFRNSHYLYGFVQTAGLPSPESVLTTHLDTDRNGQPDTRILISSNGVEAEIDGVRTPIEDGAAAFSTGIEFRIPLRATGVIDALPNLCIESSDELAFALEPDCNNSALPLQRRDDIDPLSIRTISDFLAYPRTTSTVNVRSGPSTNFTQLYAATERDLFRVLGRNPDSTWLLLENARVRGWMSAELTIPNGDIALLPVVETE